MTNPPPSLAKRGLLHVEDNLLPGQEISFGRMFCLIFRPELEARIWKKKNKPCSAPSTSLPSPSE